MRRIGSGLFWMVASVLPLWGQGPLTPPGAPAPTQKSLQEIWDRIGGLETQCAQLQQANQTLLTQMSVLLDANQQTPWTFSSIDTQGTVGWHANLAIAPDGKPAVAYYDETNFDLKFAKFDGTSWSITTVASAGGTGHEPSLAYGADGQPAISFRNWSAQTLQYAKFDGTSWNVQTVDQSGDVGRYSSLAFDRFGVPKIAYYDVGNGDLKWATQIGNLWIPTTVDSGGNVGQFAQLQVLSDQNSIIAYYDATNAALKVAILGTSGWSITTLPTNDWDLGVGHDYGKFCSMKLDPSGFPVIAMTYGYKNNSDLSFVPQVIRWDGFNWRYVPGPFKTYEAYPIARDVSLAISPSGVPVVSFRSMNPYNNNHGALRVARWVKSPYYGTSEELNQFDNYNYIEMVDARNDTGSYSSLRFGPDGYPIVVYFCGATGDLQMARKVFFKP